MLGIPRAAFVDTEILHPLRRVQDNGLSGRGQMFHIRNSSRRSELLRLVFAES